MEEKKSLKSNLLKNKSFILTFGVVLLAIIFILYLATSVIPKTLVTLSRASFSDKVVVSNSYLIGEKILAKADGKDNCVITVFLLDKNGKAVKGKNVELVGMENIAPAAASDSNGKITFNLTSTEETQYRLNANYQGQPLPQTIVVTFRN